MEKSDAAGSWLIYAWAMSIISTLGSLYLSEILDFVPCSLCWYQRILVYPLSILLGIASVKKDAGIVTYVMPLVYIGSLISAYHIWIQERPSTTNGPFCGPNSCVTDVLNAFGFLTVPMLALTAQLIIAFCLIMARKVAKQLPIA